MFIDAENRFSDKQTITTGSDSGIVSTNLIDLGSQPGDVGVGENLYVVVDVTTALNHGGSATALKAELIQDDANDGNTGSVVQVIGSFGPTAAAGSRLIARVQPGISKRYLAVKYTAAGAALTAGAVRAYLTSDVDQFKAYDNAFTVG